MRLNETYITLASEPFDLLPAAPAEEALDAGVAVAAPKGRPFSILAYTGAVFERPYGRCVIDLAGMEAVDPTGTPIYRNHDPNQYIGRSGKLGEGLTISPAGVKVTGRLFAGVRDAEEASTISDQGGRWRASVGIDIDADAVETLDEGETAEVNGREVEGPIFVFRSTKLKEVSFVPIGADASTSAVALSGHHQKEANMAGTAEKDPVATERARVRKIRETFKDDTQFALEAIDKGWDVVEAKAAYADRLAEKLSAAEAAAEERERAFQEKLAAAEAAKQPAKPGLAERLGSTTGATTGPASTDPIERWNEMLAAEVERVKAEGVAESRSALNLSEMGRARQQAVRNLVNREPKAYREYLSAFNERGLGRRRVK